MQLPDTDYLRLTQTVFVDPGHVEGTLRQGFDATGV